MKISSDAIRGYIDIIVLGLLMEKDMYGYEITKEVSQRCDNQYQLNEATLYSGFRRMEKNHLIVSYYDDNTIRGSKRRYYTITKLGIEYYGEKCKEWQHIKKLVNLFVKEGNNE